MFNVGQMLLIPMKNAKAMDPKKAGKRAIGIKAETKPKSTEWCYWYHVTVNINVYKIKLIFVNVKTQKNGEISKKILEEVPFNIIQLKSKFKKCVAECKRVALTIKSATGIERFRKNKKK